MKRLGYTQFVAQGGDWGNVVIFFFSSRRRHTRFDCDWSSDVCSSDLVRARRMFGGAMRQSGILAAAGLWALDHNLGRLAEDHANARLLAERLAGLRGVSLDLATVQSNIVIFQTEEGAPDAATVVARAQEVGVLVSAFGARTVRAVTHLDVSRADCELAADRLVQLLRVS